MTCCASNSIPTAVQRDRIRTVKDPAQFKALYAYSPYHHVKDGTGYPAIIFPTGENDHRVNPMQSRKMTARLQAASSSGRPILLRTSANAGHGIGTSLDEGIEQEADVLSFLFDQLESARPRQSKLKPDRSGGKEMQIFAPSPIVSVLPWIKACQNNNLQKLAFGTQTANIGTGA